MNIRTLLFCIIIIIFTGIFCSSPPRFLPQTAYAPQVVNLQKRLEKFQGRSKAGSIPYNYYRCGVKGKQGILFIHNLGANGIYWVNQLEHFQETLFMVAPDLIGFGKTGKPDIDYSIDSFIAFSI